MEIERLLHFCSHFRKFNGLMRQVAGVQSRSGLVSCIFFHQFSEKYKHKNEDLRESLVSVEVPRDDPNLRVRTHRKLLQCLASPDILWLIRLNLVMWNSISNEFKWYLMCHLSIPVSIIKHGSKKNGLVQGKTVTGKQIFRYFPLKQHWNQSIWAIKDIICIYIYIYTHVYLYIYIHMCIYICIYIYMQISLSHLIVLVGWKRFSRFPYGLS